MKKIFLILGAGLVLFTGVAGAQNAVAATAMDFTCTRTQLGPLTFNWSCNTTFPSTPKECTVNTDFLGHKTTICQDANSILPLSYCRGGGQGTDVNVLECGPAQQAIDNSITGNLTAHGVSGQVSCQLDTSYPGGSKYACIPANLSIAGCNPSRYGKYLICNDPPPGCTPSGLALPGGPEVISCAVPAEPGAPVSAQQTPSPTANCGSAGNQLGYCPLEPLPGIQSGKQLEFAPFLNAVFKLLIIAGALIAVVTLVYAGISYILSEAFETKGEAKRRMQAALWGLVILLGAWLMLNTINPTLLNFNLSSLGVSGTSSQNPGNNSAAQSTISAPNEADLKDCTSQVGYKYVLLPSNTYGCIKNP